MYNNGSSFKVYKGLQRKHRYEPLEHRGTLNGGLCGNGVSSFSVLGVRCLLDGLRVRYKVFIGLKEKRDQTDKYR